MERATSAPSCLGRSARERSLTAAAASPRNWRISGHLRSSSASMREVYANRMNGVSENDWKAFAERWRIAEKAEREWRRENRPSPEEAFAWCLESLRIFESMHGDPFIKDPLTLKREEEAREAWTRLRQRWEG